MTSPLSEAPAPSPRAGLVLKERDGQCTSDTGTDASWWPRQWWDQVRAEQSLGVRWHSQQEEGGSEHCLLLCKNCCTWGD